MPPVIEDEKCAFCGTCVDSCPSDVFFGSAEGEVPSVAYPYECWHCSVCVECCPQEAITLRFPLSHMILYK